MKLRPELFDDYICTTIVGKFNYSDKRLHCYVELLTQKVYFLITCKEDNYTSCQYNTLKDAICAWNEYKDN